MNIVQKISKILEDFIIEADVKKFIYITSPILYTYTMSIVFGDDMTGKLRQDHQYKRHTLRITKEIETKKNSFFDDANSIYFSVYSVHFFLIVLRFTVV